MHTLETEGVTKYHLRHKSTVADSGWNISAINSWRTLLYQLQLIGQQKDRYLGYGYGNISQRMQAEKFLISGTQTGGITELSIDNYCLVTAADLSSNTLYSAGPCKPSSEALSHASVYAQDSNIQCIIHAHNPDIWRATQALKLAHTDQHIAYGTPDMAHAITDLFNSGQLKYQPIFTMLGHLCTLIAILALPSISHAQNIKPAPNGIKYPQGLTNWRVIGSSMRNDNNTQRVILGNSIAIKAARAKTNKLHWPEGAILAKLVWKNETLPTWKAATVPGDFVHTEIMVRDTKKYAATEGWGYARWTGLKLKPHGQDSSFAETCANCHKAAESTAFVFTQPAKLP